MAESVAFVHTGADLDKPALISLITRRSLVCSSSLSSPTSTSLKMSPPRSPEPTERSSLLQRTLRPFRNHHVHSQHDDLEEPSSERSSRVARIVVQLTFLVVFLLALLLMLFYYDRVQDGRGGKKHDGGWPLLGGLPKDSDEAAEVVLSMAPVIVRNALRLSSTLYSHSNFYIGWACWYVVSRFALGDRGTSPLTGPIDLPILARGLYHNNVTAIDLANEMPGHVDIPRLRKGKVGGFFWSVYVGCPSGDGPDFVLPTWRVRYVSFFQFISSCSRMPSSSPVHPTAILFAVLCLTAFLWRDSDRLCASNTGIRLSKLMWRGS